MHRQRDKHIAVRQTRAGRALRGVALALATLVVLGATAAAVLLHLSPSQLMRRTFAPEATSTQTGAPASTETTALGSDRDHADAESAVADFYTALSAGKAAVARALMTADSSASITTKVLNSWKPTTFTVTRSTIASGTAIVYGHESRRAFGSSAKGVRFVLRRLETRWLVESWRPVDESTISGVLPRSGKGTGALSLTDATARDVVGTLLQARQQGDGTTIRMLTTARFQTDNAASWLDGVDNSASFTAYTITRVRRSGDALLATATETWATGTQTHTYTVVLTGGAILVDAVSGR